MTDKMPEAKFPPWTANNASMEEHINLAVNPPHYADSVNSPKHYTYGKYESIDVIEDAVQFAPNATVGTLQWQVLKYILRMWHKGKALEDAKKAQWYLARLVHKLETIE